MGVLVLNANVIKFIYKQNTKYFIYKYPNNTPLDFINKWSPSIQFLYVLILRKRTCSAQIIKYFY